MLAGRDGVWLNDFSAQFSEARGSCMYIPSSAFAAFFLSAWSFGRIETERVPTGTARLVGHMDPRGGTTTEPPTYDYLRISVGCQFEGGRKYQRPSRVFLRLLLHYHLRAVEDVKFAFRLRARP
eukprot:scaffold49905_cov65-Phaeocystis_antarctica.AAC.3